MLEGTRFGLEIVHRRYRQRFDLADYRLHRIVGIARSDHYVAGDDKSI